MEQSSFQSLFISPNILVQFSFSPSIYVKSFYRKCQPFHVNEDIDFHYLGDKSQSPFTSLPALTCPPSLKVISDLFCNTHVGESA